MKTLIAVVLLLASASCSPGPVRQAVSGQETKVPFTESVSSLRGPAQKGDAAAQFKLGLRFANGEGVPQDYTEAVRWYRKAADQGYATAEFHLGSRYEDGQGVPQDYAEAVRWYRKAADHGDAAAQLQLSFNYHSGQGVPKDSAEAVRWFRKVADRGYVIVQNLLGEMYADGDGVPQDYAEAARWYRKAADHGDVEAQFNLGLMYEDGRGVPQDYAEAHTWLNLAASRASGDRRKYVYARESLAKKMTSQGIAEAQRRAREWKPTTRGRWDLPRSAETGRRADTGTVGSFSPDMVDPPKISATPRKDMDDLLEAAPIPDRPKISTTQPRARSAGSASAVNAESAQSIRGAEDAGLVRTSYRSIEGSSSGDSVVLIAVKIGGPNRLVLSIPSGLALKSPFPSSQSMVISGLKGREIGGGKYTSEQYVVLTDEKPVRYVIEAYCAEFHKDNPPPDRFDFQAAATPDPVMACILNEARKERLSVAGTQAAVWVRTDHLTFPEMSTRMAVGKEEWSRAETVASRCTFN